MIDFGGIDIVTDRQPDTNRLQEAISSVLLTHKHRVSIINDIADYPARDAADVVCVISPAGGEFATTISIQTRKVRLPLHSALDVVSELALILHLRCLTPTDGANPYLMWLVVPGSTPTEVSVDPEALDAGAYVITR